MGGGKGGEQTVGYKHYVGMHLIACHGPVDFLTRLTVDERTAWTGLASGGQITVSAENLFGGEGREGGVSGKIDVEMGRPTQTKNSYLLSKIGAAIPAYRGVVGLVFRHCYMGNNPYLKPWRMRMQRIHVREDGIEQWYDETAPIGQLSGKHAIVIALDRSGSMAEASGTTTRLANAKTAINGLLTYLGGFTGYADIDVMVVGVGRLGLRHPPGGRLCGRHRPQGVRQRPDRNRRDRLHAGRRGGRGLLRRLRFRRAPDPAVHHGRPA